MSETFKEPTAEELQGVLLQFMGQNLGELKKLDSHIVEKNSTLKGLTLNPHQVLKTLPTVPVSTHSQPIPETIPTRVSVTPIATDDQVSNVQSDHDNPDQLMFDFVNDLQKTPSILDTIQNIDRKTNTISEVMLELNKVHDKLDIIIELVSKRSSIKKKDLVTT